MAALLLAQSMMLPAAAAPEDPEESVAATGATAATFPQEQTEAAEPVSDAAPETVPGAGPQLYPDVPVTEDASVVMGSHGVGGKVAAAPADALTVRAKGALIYDITSDTVLFAQNADDRLFPASLTKVMTCSLALDLIEEQGRDFNELVPISEELVRRVDPYGSSMELQAGEEVPLIELLYGMMVHSSNDACMAVAEYLCGSEDDFVDKMNEKAQALGCEQTHFMNVHGLHNEEHYTTPRDMARILLNAIQNETFRELYSTAEHDIPATNLSETRHMVTTNYLISETVMDLYYDSRVIGGKTGFTTPAGRCLVTVSKDPGSDLELLCVVMGAGMQVAEDGYSVISYGSFEETIRMLNFGFSSFRPTQVLSDAQTLGQFHVTGGDADVEGRIRESVNTLLPPEDGIDDINYEYLLSDGVIQAPLEEGVPLGIVRVWSGDRCLAQQEMYSASAIRQAVPMADIPEVQEDGVPAQGLKPMLLAVMVLLCVLVLVLVVVIVRKIRRAILHSRRKKKVAKRRAAREREQRRANVRRAVEQSASRRLEETPARRRTPDQKIPEQKRKTPGRNITDQKRRG